MSGQGDTNRGPDLVSYCPDKFPWGVPGPPWDATDCLLSAQNCPQKKYTNLYTFLGASFWPPGRPLEAYSGCLIGRLDHSGASRAIPERPFQNH